MESFVSETDFMNEMLYRERKLKRNREARSWRRDKRDQEEVVKWKMIESSPCVKVVQTVHAEMLAFYPIVLKSLHLIVCQYMTKF